LIALAVLAQTALGSGEAAWLMVVAVFILLNCWGGLMHARMLARIARMPRRDGFACPDCKERPVLGPVWRCDKCLKPFDTFATQAVCPHCGTQFPVTLCFDCGSARPMSEWMVAAPAEPPKLA
jgi:DNA-directed RNA polymerase subunit RPC12/RpoP